jgi:hypothetical protein
MPLGWQGTSAGRNKAAHRRMNNIYRFRTVKHGGPQKKFKMLPDRPRRLRWLLVVLALAILCGMLAVAVLYIGWL